MAAWAMPAQVSSPAPPGDGGRAPAKAAEGIPAPAPAPAPRPPPPATGLAGGISPHAHAQPRAPNAAPGAAAPSRRSTSALLSRTSTAQNGRDRDAKGPPKGLSSTPPANAVGLDPLSTQIYLRTNSNTEPSSVAQRLRSTAGRPESPTPDSLQDAPARSSNGPADAPRDRRKGPSFLSRLGMRGASRRRGDALLDSDSELGDLRTDGSNARAMTSMAAAGHGFVPLHKEPPRYIRVKQHDKKEKTFNRLFLAQELRPSPDDEPQGRAPATAVGSRILKAGDAIWAADFSADGRYFAVAGKDQTVRVFSVISTPEERRAHEEDEESRSKGSGEKLSAPVFHTKPTREFEGHTGEVLALSWSKNNFLLSSSMDKTVKLWHMSRPECLCSFRHNDLVTSISFHPTDDRFFLAGSLDAQLRLWSIPDKAVAFSAQANEFITAVAFSPDGKTAICGVLSGLCLFYETEGLAPQFQIHVRSSRGKNAKGSKITGISTASVADGPDKGDVRVLISSNDSRVRIYSLRTRMLEVKFRGLENQSSQIHARFSDDGAYVISGSEDRRAYIWGAGHAEADAKDKQPYECFDAHPEVVTTALMAPVKSKLLLSASGDPIYDLCNPPPVQLLSCEERAASQTRLSDGGRPDPPSKAKKPEESPAYLARCKHVDGNIIVTTDRTGTIKVFRQDCAFAKRQQNMWETGSKLSGKLAGLGRSSSILTKTSGGSRVQSRRGSLNLGPAPAQQPASDRIMSWRQDVGERPGASATTTRSERSTSPIKMDRSPPNPSAANLAWEARRQPYTSSPVLHPHHAASPAGSVQVSKASLRLHDNEETACPAAPPTPSYSMIGAEEPGADEDKGEGGFWNLSRWKGNLPAIPGLRFSSATVSSAPSGGPSHNRTESEAVASGRAGMAAAAAARWGLGGNDGGRADAASDTLRRRHTGSPPPAAKRPSDAGAAAAGGTNGVAQAAGEASAGKRRPDSGVAQLSAESTDDSDGAACRKCGGHSSAVGRAGRERGARVCEQCGSRA